MTKKVAMVLEMGISWDILFFFACFFLVFRLMSCLDFLVGIDVRLNAVFYKTRMLSTSNLDPLIVGKSSFKCPGN